jgi:hypothetical protein
MNAVRRAILAISVLPLASFSLVETSQGAPQQKAAHDKRTACPSTDFAAFFHNFSEKAEVQKNFIHFPLTYGKVDIISDGEPFIEGKISSYDKIPVLNHGNRLIFPDEKERAGSELHFSIQYGLRDDDFRDTPAISSIGRNSDVATVALYLNESGYQVYYRFRKERNCWFLVRIDDWST